MVVHSRDSLLSMAEGRPSVWSSSLLCLIPRRDGGMSISSGTPPMQGLLPLPSTLPPPLLVVVGVAPGNRISLCGEQSMKARLTDPPEWMGREQGGSLF